jgi:P27 family predicted phage terminase small subunit
MVRQDRQCPAWLDGAARDEWHRITASGSARHTDPATLAAYCYTSALWAATRDLIDRLEEEGAISWLNREGQERAHPALAIEARLAADLLELTEALDLEPTGREAPKPSRVLFLD